MEAFEMSSNSFFFPSRSTGRSCFLVFVVALASPNAALGQMMQCGVATQQLQQYMYQVNAAANSEYYQGIPMKCAGNPFCFNMLLQQLNSWYIQQSSLINGWYGQIVSQCNASASPTQGPGVVVNSPQAGQAPSMNGQNIEELTVDDADRTVRIRIPSNPKGFR
jgi:hypothetical protein